MFHPPLPRKRRIVPNPNGRGRGARGDSRAAILITVSVVTAALQRATAAFASERHCALPVAGCVAQEANHSPARERFARCAAASGYGLELERELERDWPAVTLPVPDTRIWLMRSC